jgi:heme oxygenase
VIDRRHRKRKGRHISGTATYACDPPISLAQRMRGRTRELHVLAERSGIVAALLRGQVSRSCYALYLRNLLPAYQAMEQALRQNHDRPEFAGLAQPSLYRAESIVADLEDLAGSEWATCLPLLPSGDRYAARVGSAGRGATLIAHCYTRYLGDLYGGQVLGQRLAKRFGPTFRALAFNRFPGIPDLDGFRAAYHANLNRAGDHLADIEAVVEEAAVAFDLNIQLSLEVDAFRPPDLMM